MPQKKYDGIIEGVRYTPEGKLSHVRIYERRGPTYSDRTMLTRTELLQRLRAKKKFAVGVRKIFLSSTFDVVADVRLAGSRGQEAIVAGASSAVDRDDLQGAPLF
jgi:hypothetical protein